MTRREYEELQRKLARARKLALEPTDALTLERIAQAIEDFCRTHEVMDTSGRRHRGLLAGADLAAWQATIEAPVTLDYHG